MKPFTTLTAIAAPLLRDNIDSAVAGCIVEPRKVAASAVGGYIADPREVAP